MDMADKYPPAEAFEDDEPTLRVNMAPIIAKANLQEKRYPGVGLVLALVTGLLFWGTVGYFLFR